MSTRPRNLCPRLRRGVAATLIGSSALIPIRSAVVYDKPAQPSPSGYASSPYEIQVRR
jgi:hypothetical protein